MTKIDMNLNNTKETEIRRNGRWLLCLRGLLKCFNGRTFNAVPAGTATNDETWRMAA